jgi:DNA-binding XRE family transcriptional regulator
MRRCLDRNDISAVIKKHCLADCFTCKANGQQFLERDELPWTCARFGRLMQAHRARLGLSQRDLASKSGVSHVQIANIEIGKHSPTASTLFRLADHLGLEPMVVPKLFVPAVTNLLQQAEKFVASETTRKC